MSKMPKAYGIAMTALSLVLATILVAMVFVNAGLRNTARDAQREADELRLALAAYGEADPALPASTEGGASEEHADLLARVNGQDVSLYEALNEYQSQAYYARMFGVGDAELQQLKADIAEGYVRYAILLQKCSELGFDVLTTEEYQIIGQTAQAQYDEMYSYYLSDYVQGGMDEEEARAEILALFAEQSYTVEALVDQLCKSTILDRLYAHLTDGIELTEEALSDYYEQKLAEDRQRFDESPLSFEYAVSENLVYVYVPQGFRSIKQILIRLTDDEQQHMADIRARLASITLEEQSAALVSERQALEAEAATIYAAYDEKVAQVQSRLDAGESFDQLLEQLGEDENMRVEPYRTKGYFVSAEAQLLDAELVSAAMALTRPGEISGPVRDGTGIHFLRYEGEVAPGAILLSQVRDALSEEALIARKQAAYDEAVAAWYAEAQVELYLENLTEQ